MTKNKINIYVNSKHYSKNNDIEIFEHKHPEHHD